MGADDLAHDVESQPEAFLASLAPAKGIEEHWQKGRVDGGAAVADLERDVVTTVGRAHIDRRASAVVRGVADQVGEDAPEPIGIPQSNQIARKLEVNCAPRVADAALFDSGAAEIPEVRHAR